MTSEADILGFLEAEVRAFASEAGLEADRQVKIFIANRTPAVGGWVCHFAVHIGMTAATGVKSAQGLLNRLLSIHGDTDTGDRGFNLNFDGSTLGQKENSGLMVEMIQLSAFIGMQVSAGTHGFQERPEDWHD